MSDVRITRDARDGETYVCGACGRIAKRIEDFKETSCQTWAVLVHESSIVHRNGRIVSATAVQSTEADCGHCGSTNHKSVECNREGRW